MQKRPDLPIPTDQPLIAVFVEEAGREVIRYFHDAAEADAALAPPDWQELQALAGALADLDWEEAKRELDRIRHESEPTPVIEEP